MLIMSNHRLERGLMLPWLLPFPVHAEVRRLPGFGGAMGAEKNAKRTAIHSGWCESGGGLVSNHQHRLVKSLISIMDWRKPERGEKSCYRRDGECGPLTQKGLRSRVRLKRSPGPPETRFKSRHQEDGQSICNFPPLPTEPEDCLRGAGNVWLFFKDTR